MLITCDKCTHYVPAQITFINFLIPVSVNSPNDHSGLWPTIAPILYTNVIIHIVNMTAIPCLNLEYDQ